MTITESTSRLRLLSYLIQILSAMLFYRASFFFLIVDSYFLIAAVAAKIFSPIAELVIPTGIPTKEQKSEMETHPVILEDKIKKCSI